MVARGRHVSIGVVVVTAALALPLAAPASTHRTGKSVARQSAAAGVVLGGTSAQGWPVIVELSKNGRRVVRTVGGLRLNCTSGSFVNLFDTYMRMTVSKSRKFAAAFGPETVRNDNGTTADFEGSITGALNRSRSRATGTWQLKFTEHDAAGAVTDTCDSGVVKWSAKQ